MTPRGWQHTRSSEDDFLLFLIFVFGGHFFLCWSNSFFEHVVRFLQPATVVSPLAPSSQRRLLARILCRILSECCLFSQCCSSRLVCHSLHSCWKPHDSGLKGEKNVPIYIIFISMWKYQASEQQLSSLMIAARTCLVGCFKYRVVDVTLVWVQGVSPCPFRQLLAFWDEEPRV